MELTDITSIMWAIYANMTKGRDYTFDKIVAILHANDYDVDTYKVALALQLGLDTTPTNATGGKFYSLESGGVTVFGLS